MKSPTHFFKIIAIAASLLAGARPVFSDAAEPVESPELTALRREFEKRTNDALRPIYSWYDAELGRLEHSITGRGNLDAALAVRQEHDRFKAEQALMTPAAFKLALEDTRWRFNGDDTLHIVFKKDGFIGCAAWEKLGYSHKWQVAGPRTISFTVVRGPTSVGKRGTLVFAPDLQSFEGTNPDGVKVNASPRLK